MRTALLRTWTQPETLFEALGVRFAEGDGGGGSDGGSGDGGDQGGSSDGGQQGSGDGQGDGKDEKDGKDGLPDDPAALRAEIARLRRENGTARTAARDKAATDARNAVVQDIGKALGLIKDGDKAPSAEVLAEQVRTSTAAARTASVELAVFRAAGSAGADADALLDSRAFLAKVADLDPAAADFQTKVTAAINDAVKANPKLKTVRVAGSSSVDHSAGGTGEGRAPRKPRGLANAVADHYAG